MLEVDRIRLCRDGRPLSYDLSVAEGRILAIQGRSGVGKSTLLSVIAGFTDPDEGDVRWQGNSLLPLPPERRPVSLLFQDHNLFEHISVQRNLGLGFGREGPPAALWEAAERLGIGDQLEKKPGSLSGGQRQRVALVRALLRPEPLVLLDEPFAELDAETRKLATRWVRETAQQKRRTVLLVTHQDEDVDAVADERLQL